VDFFYDLWNECCLLTRVLAHVCTASTQNFYQHSTVIDESNFRLIFGPYVLGRLPFSRKLVTRPLVERTSLF
jgi:hypothetical protein